MCGIIGIVGNEPVADRLVDGLRRMEYRGYDSAGVCTLDDGALIRRRAEGKLNNLVAELVHQPAPGDAVAVLLKADTDHCDSGDRFTSAADGYGFYMIQKSIQFFESGLAGTKSH